MKINNFFPTGILFHQLPSNLIQELKSLILPRLDKLESNNEQYTDFYLENKIISLNEIKPLLNEINKCLIEYKNTTQISINIIPNLLPKEYWIQNYKKGNFHSWHHHGKTNTLSVVYWIQSEKNSSNLIIKNPNPYVPFWKEPQTIYEHETIYSQEYIKISPKEGGLIIFPSFLYHKVEVNNNSHRTILALNY